MTTIQSNTVSNSLLNSMNPSASSLETSDAAKAQDRFMKLLVTQMKNQDPLNPMDNAQMTSQLAQLSTVTGIDKLNGTMQTMMGSFQSNQSVQAAGMIGHGVLVPGSGIDLASGSGVFGVELSGPADNVTVNIRDASGKVVHSIDLGPHEAGSLPLQWDGMMDNGVAAADGKYKFDISAKLGGTAVTANALSFGQVASVSTNSQGVKLNVSGVGAVNLADIRQIL
jgi:flagellar basal-body rod modification protein FlgD